MTDFQIVSMAMMRRNVPVTIPVVRDSLPVKMVTVSPVPCFVTILMIVMMARMNQVLVVREYMNRILEKPALCICKNKGADQLRSNSAADQHFSLHAS